MAISTLAASKGLEDRFSEQELCDIVGILNDEIISMLEEELSDSPAARQGLELEMDSTINYYLEGEEVVELDDSLELNVVIPEEVIQAIMNDQDDVVAEFVEKIYEEIGDELEYHFTV